MSKEKQPNKGEIMTLTDQQIEELKEAAKPLIKWLNENCRPHVTILVEPTGAELVEGVAAVQVTEFLKD